MSVLSHGQEIVLRNHLADYPEDATFQDVMYMLEDEKEEVSIWAPFEEWNKIDFIRHLEILANDIDKAVVVERDKL